MEMENYARYSPNYTENLIALKAKNIDTRFLTLNAN